MKIQCRKSRKEISLALDNRLDATSNESLQGHLDICQSCRNWQIEQIAFQGMFSTNEAIEPSPMFYRKLQMKIDSSSKQGRSFFINPFILRPLLQRAALVLIMIFAALAGYSLGNRPDIPAANSNVTAFDQTLNLEAFADLPTESFGAVYNRLLLGGRP